MDSSSAASLVNVIGFTVGIALYAMLAVMVVRTGSGGVRVLLGATAALGLIWNAGELAVIVQKDLGWSVSPLLAAAAYSALGFLPSVVVHSALTPRLRLWPIGLAYTLSATATILHFYNAITSGTAPSALALQILTMGAVVLAAVLLVLNYREALERKAIWGTALLIFAAGALHLSFPGDEKSWPVELLAHQSSLPLALVILYQNYRFAFADLFLKRAVSVILLASVAIALYAFIGVPMSRLHEGHGATDVQATAVMLALWIATALAYPSIYRFAVILVDRALLKRPDYGELQAKVGERIDAAESIEEVLDVVASEIGNALTASERDTTSADELASAGAISVSVERDGALIQVPTHEAPFYSIRLGKFEGGRRLLSDEVTVLESVSLIAARKIDGLRVTHERCDRELRENEIAKLATEAQLTALRAQINPHFLFNALTTIGYLIQTSPDKAFETLIHLTKLLRGVLSSTAEFTTLGSELKLIGSYLDIERARFEEKLEVSINIDKELEAIRVPALILQPLVENAIKHAIAENRDGGKVTIGASAEDGELLLYVADTGSGRSRGDRRSISGIGTNNITERLERYYGGRASFELSIDPNGSTSRVRLPISGHGDLIETTADAAGPKSEAISR